MFGQATEAVILKNLPQDAITLTVYATISGAVLLDYSHQSSLCHPAEVLLGIPLQLWPVMEMLDVAVRKPVAQQPSHVQVLFRTQLTDGVVFLTCPLLYSLLLLRWLGHCSSRCCCWSRCSCRTLTWLSTSVWLPLTLAPCLLGVLSRSHCTNACLSVGSFSNSIAMFVCLVFRVFTPANTTSRRFCPQSCT